MDATCTIQDSIHVFRLVHKYVSRILGTYHSGTKPEKCLLCCMKFEKETDINNTEMIDMIKLYCVAYCQE